MARLYRFNVYLARKMLQRFDRKHALSSNAMRLASEKGRPVRSVRDDFGRTLQHYVPIFVTLKKFGHALKGKRLLHIASSTGVFTRFLQDKGIKAVALDADKTASEIAGKIGNRRVVNGDANRLPFEQNSFDFFVSDNFLLSGYLGSSRLKYPLNEERALRELHRVLKPGGIGVVKYEPDFIDHWAFFRLIDGIGFKIIKVDGYYDLIVVRKVRA